MSAIATARLPRALVQRHPLLVFVGLTFALPIILPIFRFPPPSGPYAIGTLTYHWVDADRPEIFRANPQARRELMVQIWYPAMGAQSAPRAPYMADADAVMAAFGRIHAKPAFIFGHFTYVTTNTISSAPLDKYKNQVRFHIIF
ncbi:MAG: hypothetical protein HGA45_32125 [Chloroflexales bacterium]|nr:hypothetical protein [Chloroflexales bacterium]